MIIQFYILKFCDMNLCKINKQTKRDLNNTLLVKNEQKLSFWFRPSFSEQRFMLFFSNDHLQVSCLWNGATFCCHTGWWVCCCQSTKRKKMGYPKRKWNIFCSRKNKNFCVQRMKKLLFSCPENEKVFLFCVQRMKKFLFFQLLLERPQTISCSDRGWILLFLSNTCFVSKHSKVFVCRRNENGKSLKQI